MTTEHNPVDLDSQDAQRAEKREANAQEREQQELDFKWLMAHKQGRRIMWRWLSVAGAFHGGFIPNANELQFRSGMRNFGMMLLTEIFAITPDLFNTMMKEAHDDAKRRHGPSS